MNEQDSLQMRGLLSKMGYAPSSDPWDADLILFVTCSIREKAVHKVYSELGRIREIVEENPNLIVGLAGCVAQQEKSRLQKRFPYLDLVFGPDAISELPSMVEILQKERRADRKPILNTRLLSREDFEFVNLIHTDENPIKAYVNIQKGCDNVCSFCVVPRVRGPEVSRPTSQIIEEIKALVDMGVREVTLLGQNVNSYGLKEGGCPFSQLLEKISNETELTRLQFITSHPKDVGPDLVDQFRDNPILSPSFHLPVQSGSDRILEAMRRYYTRRQYVDIIDAIRKVRPLIVFSTDFIVGFPGETERDFNETLSLLDEVQFDFSYSFAYSPRPGTTALRLPDTLSDETKSERLKILQERQRQISKKIGEIL